MAIGAVVERVDFEESSSVRVYEDHVQDMQRVRLFWMWDTCEVAYHTNEVKYYCAKIEMNKSCWVHNKFFSYAINVSQDRGSWAKWNCVLYIEIPTQYKLIIIFVSRKRGHRINNYELRF